MRTRDDDLLDVLAVSLGPVPDAEPTWAEISRLHRVLDTASSGPRPSRNPLWRLRRPATAAVAGLFVLGGASAAAAMSGAVMPEPVRVAARAVGLPVDSPALASARASLAALRDALAHQPRDLGEIRAHAQDVRARLATLSADDRATVQADADFLLAAADAALAPPPAPLGSPDPVTQPHPQSGPSPESPEASPSNDDHGHGQATPDANQGRGSDDQQSGDDHGSSSATPSGPNASAPGRSDSSGDDGHTGTTMQGSSSDHGGSSSDHGGSSSDQGGGSDGGSSHDGGGSSGSDGGHSGPN